MKSFACILLAALAPSIIQAFAPTTTRGIPPSSSISSSSSLNAMPDGGVVITGSAGVSVVVCAFIIKYRVSLVIFVVVELCAYLILSQIAKTNVQFKIHYTYTHRV